MCISECSYNFEQPFINYIGFGRPLPRRWAGAALMLGRRRRRWADIESALARRREFDVYYITTVAQLWPIPAGTGPTLYRCWQVFCVCRDAGSYSTRSVWCIYRHVLLAQFSLYVHKGGLKPDSFHFYIPAYFMTSVPCQSFFAGSELGQNWQL